MFGSELIEVIIAIIGLYILLSIVCSAIREIIEVFQRSKPYYLHRMIFDMLGGEENDNLVSQFYNHPEIYCLFRGEIDLEKIKGSTRNLLNYGGDLPSYIPPINFAHAILDIVIRDNNELDNLSSSAIPILNVATARNNIPDIKNVRLRRAVLLAIDLSGGDYKNALKNLERWFNSSMQRVTEQYKYQTSKIILLVSLIITFSLNINTVTLIDYVYRQNLATEIAAKASPKTDESGVVSTVPAGPVDLNRSPFGWNIDLTAMKANLCMCNIEGWLKILGHIAGLLLTAFAASLGAPFWFDILKRLSDFRSRNNTTAETQETPSSSSGGPSYDLISADNTDQPAAEGIDGDYDIPADEVTKDKDLPPAKGGVTQ